MQGKAGITDGYLTVSGASEAAFTEKKSRFIGRCYAVSNERESEAQISSLRKKYWEATHNCYAFRLGPRGECARSSDDGEPSGTAGMPILNVLSAEDVTNVLIVVTRYFGGILLGAGGLVRAYSKAASMALSAAMRVRMQKSARLTLTVPYPLWQTTERILNEKTVIQSTDYGESVTVSSILPEADAESLCALLIERSDGRLSPVFVPGGYESFPADGRRGYGKEKGVDEA